MVPARYLLGFKDIITERHIENCAKVMLGTGMIVAFAYGTEFFYAWYSGHHYEKAIFLFRPFGPYAWAFWTMFLCNICAPQLMWVQEVLATTPSS